MFVKRGKNRGLEFWGSSNGIERRFHLASAHVQTGFPPKPRKGQARRLGYGSGTTAELEGPLLMNRKQAQGRGTGKDKPGGAR